MIKLQAPNDQLENRHAMRQNLRHNSKPLLNQKLVKFRFFESHQVLQHSKSDILKSGPMSQPIKLAKSRETCLVLVCSYQMIGFELKVRFI